MIQSVTSQPAVMVALFLGLAVLILIGWIIHLEWRFHKLFKGGPVTDLEKIIQGLVRGHEAGVKFQADLEKYLATAEKRMRRSMQASEVIRFNPFKGDGSGGTQSSTTALLSEEGDGFVHTVLYARDRVSAFTKPVLHFSSPIELTDEEVEAVKRAKEKLDDSKK